jgi:hypothetical protein
MERNANLSAIEALAKHPEPAITHLPPLYSTPTFGLERGEDMTRPFRIITHPWPADQSVTPVSMPERTEKGATT